MGIAAGIKNKASSIILAKPVRKKCFFIKLPVFNLAILSIIGLAFTIINMAGMNCTAGR